MACGGVDGRLFLIPFIVDLELQELRRKLQERCNGEGKEQLIEWVERRRVALEMAFGGTEDVDGAVIL